MSDKQLNDAAVELASLAERINDEHRACETAAATAIRHAIRCGELLLEAKETKLGSSRTSGVTAGRAGEADALEASVAMRNLVREYKSLEKAKQFTEEHRARVAWEKYDEANAVVENKGRAARDNMLKAAEQFERMAIPFPGGHQIRTESIEHLSLTQGERSRIMDRLGSKGSTASGASKKPRRRPGEYDEHKTVLGTHDKEGKLGGKANEEPTRYDILRQEYALGLDLGGPQGAAICRAVVGIAEDEGGFAGVDEIVGKHRTERQWDYLQNAAQARTQANQIATRAPLPSYPRPGGPQSVEELASRKRSALGLERKGYAGSGPLFAKKKRKPSWK
jgi:hypothetical protein